MSMAEVKVEITPVGVGTIIVNGEDITKRVQAFQIEGAVDEPTILRLQMVNVVGVVDGEGVVEVGVPADLDAILASFSAAELEEEATGRMGWGDGGNLTALIIEVLRERVRAAQS